MRGQRAWALCAAFALVAGALVAGEARSEGTGACAATIGPATATVMFDRLLSGEGRDGCKLAGVTTERSRMEIRWEKAGSTLPAATIEPVSCVATPLASGPSLALRAPAELGAACPDALAAMIEATRALDAPTAAGEARFSRAAAEASWVFVCVVLGAAVLVAARVLRRGASG